LIAGFDSVAAYYEVLSDSAARLEREGPFLRECLERAPGMRVVDLACGTGLHAEFFANLGAHVTAFDLSQEMIAHARARRPHANIRYEVGDMRGLRGGPWDLALCLGNSLSLLPTLDDVEKTLQSVIAALSPGGRFVFQVLNYAAEANRQPRHRVDVKWRDGVEVVAVKSLVPHGDRMLLSLAFYAFDANAARSVSESSVLISLTAEQVTTCATRAGFRNVTLYGGFDFTEYRPEGSSDLIGIFEKSVE